MSGSTPERKYEAGRMPGPSAKPVIGLCAQEVEWRYGGHAGPSPFQSRPSERLPIAEPGPARLMLVS